MTGDRGIGAWWVYTAIRVAAALLDAFPVEWNLRTARLFGSLWWALDKRHRLLAQEHLRRGYGDSLSDADIRRIGHASFQHFAMLAIETVHMPRLLSERTWQRHIRLVNFTSALNLFLTRKSVILLTGHYGNWELVGFVLSLFGLDLTAVMRPLNNAYLNDYIVRVRSRKGLKLLAKREVAAESEAILRDGGHLGFIADQSAGPKGLFVPFFGQPASTYKSIGLLAMATDSPIVVGYCRRVGHGVQYETGVQGILLPEEWNRQADPLRWITERYTALLEESIRVQPEQYLWIHRRWKTSPPRRRTVRGEAGAPSDSTASSPGSSPSTAV